MNILSIHSTTKMPTFFNMTLTFECPHCDYQNETKDEKRAKLLKRLHLKKCSKVGRTLPKRTGQDIIDARDRRNGLHVGTGGRKKQFPCAGQTSDDVEFVDVPHSKKFNHHVPVGENGHYRKLTKKQRKKKKGNGMIGTQEWDVTDKLTEAQVKGLSMKGGILKYIFYYI